LCGRLEADIKRWKVVYVWRYCEESLRLRREVEDFIGREVL
jgi:hypothetical protein